MMKLLKHLTNAPVAVALAFLLVGAPAAPVANVVPSSGDVHAATMVAPMSTPREGIGFVALIGLVGAVISILFAIIWVYEAVSGDDVKENIREWIEELEEARREADRRRRMERACGLARLIFGFTDDAGVAPNDYVPLLGDTLEMCEYAGF